MFSWKQVIHPDGEQDMFISGVNDGYQNFLKVFIYIICNGKPGYPSHCVSNMRFTVRMSSFLEQQVVRDLEVILIPGQLYIRTYMYLPYTVENEYLP